LSFAAASGLLALLLVWLSADGTIQRQIIQGN